MIKFEEAIEKILSIIEPLEAEEVDVFECAGRVLAQDVTADSNVPFSNNSAMDGYAVLYSDVAETSDENPVRLEVVDTIEAGGSPSRDVEKGRATRIFTGAMMPPGADTVVMQEFTQRDGDYVLVLKEPKEGANVRMAGEDIKEGQIVFNKGRRLWPEDAGMIAACGLEKVLVSKKPRVGILGTGDEVIAPSDPPGPGKVRNSNLYTMAAMCREAGAEPVSYGIVKDVQQNLKEVMARAAAECDFVITAGGVSVGDYDFVPQTLRELGREIFWKVRSKPGKPLLYGEIGGTPFLGLPGNPVSVAVGFDVYVWPAIMKLMDATDLHLPRMKAAIEHDLKASPDRTIFARGVVSFTAGGASVRTTGPQGSGILTSLKIANCLIIVPYGIGGLKEGDDVQIVLIDGTGTKPAA